MRDEGGTGAVRSPPPRSSPSSLIPDPSSLPKVAVGAGEVSHGCGPASGSVRRSSPGGPSIMSRRGPGRRRSARRRRHWFQMVGQTFAAAIVGWEARPAGGLARWRAGRFRVGGASLLGRGVLGGRIRLGSLGMEPPASPTQEASPCSVGWAGRPTGVGCVGSGTCGAERTVRADGRPWDATGLRTRRYDRLSM
jgi:hypothetical protein